MAFCVLPCMLSIAAHAAAAKPASMPAPSQMSAQGGSTSRLAVYVFLHQTRNDGVPGDARARTGACFESKVQTAQRGEVK